MTDVVRTAYIAVFRWLIKMAMKVTSIVAQPHVVPMAVVTISRDRRAVTTMEIVLVVLIKYYI